jgi:uncharacterized protein (TIGR02246 family)
MIGTLLNGMRSGVLGIVPDGAARASSDEADVLATIDAWIVAFDARDAARIAALYSPDAVLWGTVSPKIRTTPEAVLAYFADSTTNRPRLRMQLGERHVRMMGDVAFVAGDYTAVDPSEEGDVVMPLRYTFVLAKREGAWKIVSHHSSRTP